MNLCTFSTSEILSHDILPICPLALSRTEAKHCPCRARKYHVPPADLRVLSCQYPAAWNGKPITDLPAVKTNIQTKLAKSKPPKPEKPLKQSKEKLMSTAIATAASPDEEPEDVRPNLPSTTPGTGLTLYDRFPNAMSAIDNIGKAIFGSKMFGAANVDQGRMLALGFFANKLDPFSWKQRHHIIGGNITMSAEAMLADFRAAGGEHTIISRTPDKAAVELKHGRKKQLFEFTWTEARAEEYIYNKQGVANPKIRNLPNGDVDVAALKDNWATPRKRMQMLWARVISDGVGAMMPEVSAGRQTPEELGVIGNEIQGEIIDAEFTVHSTEHSASVNEPSDINPPTPVLEQLARPEAQAAEAVSIPQSEPPASGPAQTANIAPPAADEKLALLQEIKAIKDELQFPADKWAAVLAKRGVQSARDLDVPKLADLLANMQSVLAKRKVVAGTDEVSQWANAQVNKAAAAPVGN